MPVPARAVQGLPKLTWRGLFAPCEDATFNFSHTQVERGAYGINGAWHDHARRDPIKFDCLLHFVNTLFGGPKEFPENYNKWQAAFLDGSAGKLRHPILGTINARVEKGNVRVAAQTTAGVVVQVSFTETLVDVTKNTKFEAPQVDIKALAAQVGHDAGKFNIPFPSGILDRSLDDAINSFLGNIHASQLTASGYANQIVGRIENMIVAVEAITDPRVAPLYTNLVRLWDTIRKRARQAERLAARSTAKRITASPTTLDALAKDSGNSVEELMDLNPVLISRPSVDAGVPYLVYTDK